MEILINKSQHAYLVIGEREKTVSEIEKNLEEIFGISMVGNPDYRVNHFETLGIDEARRLKEEQGMRPFGGENKFLVASADSITREAQNALLKTFEEPAEGTYIFLVVQNEKQIISTLLSRVRVIKPTTYLPTGQVGNLRFTTFARAEEFLKTPVEKRLNLPFVKKLIEDKEKQTVISFFNELEVVIRDNIQISKMTKGDRDFFTELIKFKNYANDRSSSVKMLLEHVALAAPRM